MYWLQVTQYSSLFGSFINRRIECVANHNRTERDFHCAKLSFSRITTQQKKLWVEWATSLNRLSPLFIQNWQNVSCFLELNPNLVFSQLVLSLKCSSRFTPQSSRNWSWCGQWIQGLAWTHMIERITVNLQAVTPPSQFVCLFVLCAHRSWSFYPLLTRLMLRHVGNTNRRITSISEEVTPNGIASSDRLRGQMHNPPSHSQRTTVWPRFGRAAARGLGARPRLPSPPRCCYWGWAPNPVCSGAIDEGLAAAAAHLGRL